MSLPEITEVERLQYKPGDRFVIYVDVGAITRRASDFMADEFRQTMRLPDDVPVMVLGLGMKIAVIEDADVSL